MAKNKLTELDSALPDSVDTRDHFIGIAMRELLAQQIEQKKFGQYGVVATHAVKYADAVMAEREKATKAFVVANGQRQVAPENIPLPSAITVVDPPAKTDSEIADEIKKALRGEEDKPLGETVAD